jgi:hypothetical protein
MSLCTTALDMLGVIESTIVQLHTVVMSPMCVILSRGERGSRGQCLREEERKTGMYYCVPGLPLQKGKVRG